MGGSVGGWWIKGKLVIPSWVFRSLFIRFATGVQGAKNVAIINSNEYGLYGESENRFAVLIAISSNEHSKSKTAFIHTWFIPRLQRPRPIGIEVEISRQLGCILRFTDRSA
jgi:hypothetical protein